MELSKRNLVNGYKVLVIVLLVFLLLIEVNKHKSI